MGNIESVSKDGRGEAGTSPVQASEEPGVVRTEIDAAHHALTIDFDPKLISEERVRHVAERLAPIGHQQDLPDDSAVGWARVGRGGAEDREQDAEG